MRGEPAVERTNRPTRWLGRSVSRPRPTVVELVGAGGVIAGFGLLVGPAGVGVAVAVVALWYLLSGVYGFAAGQFLLAAAMPARLTTDLLTPELVLSEVALVVLLIGGDHRGSAGGVWYRRAVAFVVTTAVLAVVAIGVGVRSVGIVDETLVLVALGGGFAVATSAIYLWGRAVVSADDRRDAAQMPPDASTDS